MVTMGTRSPSRIFMVLVILFVLYQLLSFRNAVPVAEHVPARDEQRPSSACDGLEGLEDVFVIMRTGTTEAPRKLPPHFNTTLSCVPNYVIYSDYEEDLDGHHIYDALDEVSDEIKMTHPDFIYYNRLKGQGRDAFTQQEMAEWANTKNTNSGRDSPGWRLDKWKFLPLADKAYRARPQAKWYVFVESDTYVMWKSFLAWLGQYDAGQPWYMGQQMQIGDVVFAYGGAGFAISQPAMRRVVEHRAANLKFYDDFTAGHWAGDCVLGKALFDTGVPLHWSYPTVSGDEPADTDFNSGFGGPDRRPWCYYATSYHHLPPSEYAEFWAWEQDWNKKNPTQLPRHSDVFRTYIQPHLRAQRADWDNMASDSRELTSESSVAACRAACEADPECLQFAVSGYSCRVSNALRLGHKAAAAAQTTSGWMMERIDQFARQMDGTCVGAQTWIGP
ncbi:hypothetical protein GGR56DRAFT_10908 [Xylariaceae sp. FL0804]|nr:hypothetical protein GGR56DRAFT_10908 [Xylariaceae sp. FL0804]